MGSEVRQLLIAAALILADGAGDLQTAQFFHQKHIQLAVGWIGLGDGIETAAVVAAVADAHKGLLAVNGLAIQLHHIMLADALDHIDHRGGGVGPEAVEQGQALIIGHIRADSGIQAHGADVQGEVIVAFNEVKGGLVRIHQPVQVEKCLGIVKELDEIVAAAAGEHRHRRIGKSRHAADHLVQRSVAAAGIDAKFLSGFAGLPGDPGALTGSGGDTNFIVQLSCPADLVDNLAVFLGTVTAAGSRVDDE